MSSGSSRVKVGIRIRPVTKDEELDGIETVVSSNLLDNSVDILGRKFTFDAVYDQNISQSQLYECVGANNMLEAFLEGYNSTILAYGQTGSGKTYTMGSEAEFIRPGPSTASSFKHGLIPRFIRDMFDSLRRRKMDEKVTPTNLLDEESTPTDEHHLSGRRKSTLIDHKVKISFLEVYGEDIHDLLSDDTRHILSVREDAKGEIFVIGLEKKTINSAQDAMELLKQGTTNRTTAATVMNKKSSRSHAVLTIYLEQTTREQNDGGGGGHRRNRNHRGAFDVTSVSRFTFVDLAGSERMKKTGTQGERAKETIMINQGLLALGNVINALVDEVRPMKGEKVHVPYRDSKLTRLLQDALGGNSQTLFLACISPTDTNARETLSTLKYANRAKNIKNSPSKNIDPAVLELQRLYAHNQMLERELTRVKYVDDGSIYHFGSTPVDSGSNSGSGSGSNSGVEHKNLMDGQIGMVSDDIFYRDDVQDYLTRIRNKAFENKRIPPALLFQSSTMSTTRDLYGISEFGSITSSSLSTGSRSRALPQSTSISSAPKGMRHHNIMDNFGDSFLGMNSDEDIALLDKIIELHHVEQEYDAESHQGHERLQGLNGELEQQENMLSELKDNLQSYRFEDLSMEVRSLEIEKKSLVEALQASQTRKRGRGAKAIQKRLDSVISKLAQARKDAQKKQTMYLKAGQDAQKAHALEQKIEALQQEKRVLIKKQLETEARYEEFMEIKSREIHALKINENNMSQRLTKLEAEMQTQLRIRQEFSEKLLEKFRETEFHLMKILSKRKRSGNKRRTLNRADLEALAGPESERFVNSTLEVTPLKFLLEKLVKDIVTLSLLRASHEAKSAEYNDLMRDIVAEMKVLKEAKEAMHSLAHDEDSFELDQQISNSRKILEDLEFKLEVVEKDLDRTRSSFRKYDKNDGDDDEENEMCGNAAKFENATIETISGCGPVTKTLLWDILEFTTKSEVTKFELREKLQRKEVALSSLQDEIDYLNQRIDHLKKTSPPHRGRPLTEISNQ